VLSVFLSKARSPLRSGLVDLEALVAEHAAVNERDRGASLRGAGHVDESEARDRPVDRFVSIVTSSNEETATRIPTIEVPGAEFASAAVPRLPASTSRSFRLFTRRSNFCVRTLPNLDPSPLRADVRNAPKVSECWTCAEPACRRFRLL
jgi:hypothetical protein